MSKGYRYTGGGLTFSGVKSQDYTADQFAALGPREQRIVRLSGAWEPARGYDEQTRDELNALLAARGLNPADYRTKADVIAALEAPPATGDDDDAEGGE